MFIGDHVSFLEYNDVEVKLCQTSYIGKGKK